MNQADVWKSMVRLIARAAIVVLTIGFVPDQVTSQRRKRPGPRVVNKPWYLFTGPDQEFTLRFPQEPKQEASEQGTLTLMRMYALNTEKGMRFSINFQDLVETRARPKTMNGPLM